MRRFFKKSLALMMIATMLLPSSVTAKEIAPTVGNKQTETPPTVTKQLNIPTDVSVTTEEKQEVSTTEVKTTEASTEKDKPANEAEAVKTDATETVDKDVKETELNAFKESNDSEKMTQTLLIKADKESDIPKDGKVLSSYEDTYLVSFPDTETAKAIYEDTKTDASLNIPFGVATGNKTSSSIIEPDVLDNLEEVIKEDEKKDSSFKITDEDYSIALIDTGVPKSEKNVEFISMLDDDGYDEHGHGTSMLESIRKQDKDAKILSIKALDKNGYGDAATIYAAIKYAIERKVDVINLSISGFATEGNKCIEDVIKEAVKQGIIVVGAAGNDNLPASAFIPGGIDEIIVVGACNENNERKAFSNYGITVDYYANASSTSQASAIVTGTISANKGDIKKLDDIFFKTPDLSIFDDDLKKRNMPMGDDESLPTNEDDCYDWGSLGRELTDEEFLLLQLRDFVDNADFRVAALNASLHKTDHAKKDLRDTYKGGLYFAVDQSLIKRSNVSVSELDSNNAQGWTTKAYNTGDNHGVKFNAAEFTDDDPHKGVAGYDGNSLFVVLPLSSASSATLTKPGCYITIKSCVRGSDGNIYDWVIGLGEVTFKWTTNTAADVKQSRSDLVAFQVKDGTLPLFIAGAVNHSTGPKDTDHAAYKVDAALETYFTLGVTSNGSPVGGTLITGFKDLDQWQLFPTGQKKKVGDNWVALTAADRTGSNSIDESLEIRNVNELASKDIWVKDDTKLGVDNSGSAGILVSSTQRTQKNETSVNGNTATVYFGMNATGSTNLHWQGARCRTEIGLSYSDVLEPSTIITYADFQDPDGQYRNNLEVNRDTQLAGTAYSYTYDGTGAGTYHNVAGTWGGTPNNDGAVSTTFSIADQSFQLHVPRVSFRYTFHDNKPAAASGTVTNMPDWTSLGAGNGAGYFSKLAQNIANENPGTPVLKGYTFVGWFDTAAATGGTAYDPTYKKGEMTSNRDFYARWEPMKYYVQYDGNGATNFNEQGKNGMQEGEYTQNVVTGSTAYQIFTYDAAGEALRANGFTRRGYDYVCWNTTATRTGTDRSPGYVKPASENWVKGDGTDPTATLDGTHTYPVVTLYAVWKQKLGTETLKVVSEETGNPVSGVSLKLTNTYNNTQISTGTTGADGTVTVSNLHWFPYKWESTAVPAGYKNMQDVTFSINPANTSDESFLTVNNERILYMKHVKLTINSIVDDIIKDENAPNFMYHVTGIDVAGVAHSYDVMVQTSTNTKKGTNIVPVNSGSEEPYMFAGNYTVKQYDVSRYIPRDAQNVKNVTPNGINANANLTNNDDAEVTFPYGIKQYGGFSGVHSLINKLTK